MIRKLKIVVFITIIIALNCGLSTEQVEFETCSAIAANKLSQLGKAGEFKISNAVPVKDDPAEKVLFYVFELHPAGYIVTSAESDLPPVIAYSFSNDFFAELSGNVLLNFLKTDIPLRLNNLANLPETIISQRNNAWLQILNKPSRNSRFEQWPPEGTTPTGGWLLDTWTQSAPYNSFVPMDPVTGNRSLAGCPSIAMAEILNYHRTTNRANFNDEDDYYHNYAGRQYWIDDDHVEQDFLSFPEMNESLDTLMYHYLHELPVTNSDKAALVFACGVAATQVYTSQGSGTFGVNQAYDAYLKFNFEDISLIDDSTPDFYDQIIDNIINALPVHFASVTPAWDAGHNFVVDGYNTDDFFHINFGWGGSYNGWYLLPDEIPYGLTVVEGAVVDIVPDMFTGFISGQITLDPAVEDTSIVTLNLQNFSGDQIFQLELDESGTGSYLYEIPIGIYTATASCPEYETITCDGIMIEEDQFTNLNYHLYRLASPFDLTGNHLDGEISLSWQYSQTREFQYFNIFRNINSSAFTLLDTTSQLNYTDIINPQESNIYGYYLTAVYSQENESSASEEIYIEIIASATGESIIRPNKMSNFPNPFNPLTEINFQLANSDSRQIKLLIFNITGQKVKDLTNSIICQPGNSYSITWNGTDDNNQPLPSGIYIARLKSGNDIAARKMLLLK
jgi:hypothetical protein